MKFSKLNVLRRRSNLLWYIRLFGMLSLIFLLFLLLLLFVYTTTSNQMRQDAVKRQQGNLSRGAAALTEELSVYWTQQLPAIQRLDILHELAFYTQRKPEQHVAMLKTRKELQNIIGTADACNPFFLIMTDQQGLAISNQLLFHDLSQSMHSGVFGVHDMDYPQFRAFLENASNNGMVLTQIPIIFFKSLSNNPGGQYTPYLAIVQKMQMPAASNSMYALRLTNISALYRRLTTGCDVTSFLALQHRNEIIYTSDANIPISQMNQAAFYDRKMGMTYLRVALPFHGLYAFVALSDNTILAQLSNYSTLWKALFAAFIVLCTALIALIILYLLNPIKRLYLSLLPSHQNNIKQTSNIFAQIEQQLADKETQTTRIMHQLRDVSAILRKNLAYKLMHGTQLTTAETNVLAEYLGNSADQHYLVAIAGVISNKKTMNANNRERMELALSLVLPAPLYSWIDPSSIAVIIPIMHANTNREGNHPLLKLYEVLCDAVGGIGLVLIGAGDTHVGIEGIHVSYREGQRAFHEAHTLRRPGVLYFEETQQASVIYNVPYESIQTIYNLLELGQADEACCKLDATVAHILNAQHNMLDEQKYIARFHQEIYGIMLRIASRLREPTILSCLSEHVELISIEDWVDKVHSAFQYAAEIAAARIQESDVLSIQLVEYIKQNSNNSQLSLTSVAGAFSISERSLSRHIKEKIGNTFSNLLEKERIENAMALLLERRKSVSTIALEVGYANVATFLRAFKRRTGLTPTAWTDAQMKQRD